MFIRRKNKNYKMLNGVKKEKTSPVPLSITEPVLGGTFKPEMAKKDKLN